jgi:hypothetical protein
MSLLEEREPTPSLALIATAVAVVAALAFGGVWAFANASHAEVSHQTPASAPVEGNS